MIKKWIIYKPSYYALLIFEKPPEKSKARTGTVCSVPKKRHDENQA